MTIGYRGRPIGRRWVNRGSTRVDHEVNIMIEQNLDV
jgi:hypothetical protein